MNAILSVDRTGLQWAYLPHDFPPRQTVFGYFARWQKEGSSPSSTASCGAGSPAGRLRSGPSAGAIDAPSVKAHTSVLARSQGIDADRKIDLMARRLTGESTISWRDPTPAQQNLLPG